MNQEDIDQVNIIYDGGSGSVVELYEFIKPFLEKDDPYALYLSASFSLSEWNESAEEFDKRCVDSLTKAAEGNIPEAMYRLSQLYFYGDGIKVDIGKGKLYLDKAMALGCGVAKLSVGVNMYYGSNGYTKDIGQSIKLVSEAAEENIEGAADTLKKIKSSI